MSWATGAATVPPSAFASTNNTATARRGFVAGAKDVN